MLHSGHVAFFEEAAAYGDLYVGLGSDRTIAQLKGRKTINTDRERLYMVNALKVVKEAWINQGSGMLDFELELRELKPDIFFVNEDGYTPDKQKLCEELGIELKVSKRIPHQGLPTRSTTALRKECHIPFRLDLAGGWLDQPFVSKHFPVRSSPSPSNPTSSLTTGAAWQAAPDSKPLSSGKPISLRGQRKAGQNPFLRGEPSWHPICQRFAGFHRDCLPRGKPARLSQRGILARSHHLVERRSDPALD
jgi:Cytidylyltransferase